jgi:hypothetical protein
VSSVDLRAGFGVRDVALLTFDALRYDVAAAALAAGRTPNLAALLGAAGWDRRHAPGTFTLPAHEAIFAGFFPTPADDPSALRPVALRFPGSRTTGPDTLTLSGHCLISAYRDAGYVALCVGGTSFFDPRHRLARRFTDRFDRAVFDRSMGVTSATSPAAQVAAAVALLGDLPADRRVWLFINLSATHPPTRPFAPGHAAESVHTQAAALAAIDAALPPLLDVLRARGGASLLLGADHGTCFGEDGLTGHRHAHAKVLEVPWAERELRP